MSMSLSAFTEHARATLRRLMIERDPVLMQGREGRWRWPWVIAGTAATPVMAVLLFGVLMVLLVASAAVRGDQDFELWLRSWPNSLKLSRQWPDTFAFWLVQYGAVLLAPLLIFQWVHGVSWRCAFSYRDGFRWSQFVRAAIACLIALGTLDALSFYMEADRYEFRWSHVVSLRWFVVAMAVIFVQSLSEEVLFKGYLLRVWGALVPLRLPIASVLILIFVSLHLGNPDARTDTAWKLGYLALDEVISFSLFFRTQNLAASAGLHWMRNTHIILFVGTRDSGSDLMVALYTEPEHVERGELLLYYGAAFLPFVLVIVLLLWPRSPLYLPKAETAAESPQ